MNTEHHIGVEHDGTRFKATVADLNITVYGDTHQEAVQNAQKAIVAVHIQAQRNADAARTQQGHIA